MSPAAEPSLSQHASFALTWMTTRRSTVPRRLDSPGPSQAQIDQLFQAADAACSPGLTRCWRFVMMPPDRRAALAEAFAQALKQRDAAATAEQVAQARDKAFRAPCVAVVVADLGADARDPLALQRMIGVGAAVQNGLLMAHSMGLAAGLTSGQAMESDAMRALLSLPPHEHAVCFINVGTSTKKPSTSLRPQVQTFVRTW